MLLGEGNHLFGVVAEIDAGGQADPVIGGQVRFGLLRHIDEGYLMLRGNGVQQLFGVSVVFRVVNNGGLHFFSSCVGVGH